MREFYVNISRKNPMLALRRGVREATSLAETKHGGKAKIRTSLLTSHTIFAGRNHKLRCRWEDASLFAVVSSEIINTKSVDKCICLS